MTDPMARSYRDAIAALNLLQLNFASVEATRKLGPSVNRNQLSIGEVYEYIRRIGYQPKEFNRLNCIHVTGTKGKGSTCAFTELILRQYLASSQGISKVGLFTSPHLRTVRERIRIDGKPISEPLFAKYFFEVWDRLSATVLDVLQWPTLQPLAEVKPMYFKYLTVMLFHVFMSEGVDTAIYEVGVGGEYDSTNIIDTPTVCGVTSLGIDHTFMLGNTIEEIATNKAGIAKKGVKMYLTRQKEYPQLEAVVINRATERGASEVELVDNELPQDVELGLAGDFQRTNAELAVKLAREHLNVVRNKNLETTSGNLEIITGVPPLFLKGLAEACWEGRCQTIVDSKVTWYIDGAHTIELVAVASKWFSQKPRKQGVARVLVFNQQSRDNSKDLLSKLHLYTGSFDYALFTTNVTWALGYSSDLVSMNTLKEQVEKLEVQHSLADTWKLLAGDDSKTEIFANIESAVNFIRDMGTVEVFVCGSLHLVGGLLVVLDGKKDEE